MDKTAISDRRGARLAGAPGRARHKGRAGSSGPQPVFTAPPETALPPLPQARSARLRARHLGILVAFVLLVGLPVAGAAWYLWERAADRYASVTAFSVRSEEVRPAADILGSLSQFSRSSSTDADILYQYIRSQDMVARINAQLDLRARFSRHHARDPVFGFNPEGTLEDLVDYWQRALRIAHDTGTGLIELRVLAFDPYEAQEIAAAVLAESTRRINALSAIAREDATRYAREELELAQERLRGAREALTAFRLRTLIVDPAADIQGQMGLLNTLQAELAQALIALDLLRETVRVSDPRVHQAERQIEVIRARLAEERARFGTAGTGPGGESYAALMGEYERLNLDREFAEMAYHSALSAHDAALADAQRTSRYLAAHIAPTLADSARYPQRLTLLGLTGFFLFLLWAIGALVYYSIRDSR